MTAEYEEYTEHEEIPVCRAADCSAPADWIIDTPWRLYSPDGRFMSAACTKHLGDVLPKERSYYVQHIEGAYIPG